LKKRHRYFVFFVLPLALILLAVLHYFYVDGYSKNTVYRSVDRIPYRKVGLLLGTSKYVSKGKINGYYRQRLKATMELYRAGKIDYVLISGDNSSKYYNEPVTMKKDLVQSGIPANKIFLDYAGFRTYDSMYRAREIFGLDSLTVISQDFHLRRAIYIGKKLGMNPVGYVASMPNVPSAFRMYIREVFARLKATYDIWINNKPKFLGEKITIVDE